MRRGAVPILVALADADEAAVTHINGNEKLLPCLSGDRALAEHHLADIDVVVNSLEGLDCPRILGA